MPDDFDVFLSHNSRDKPAVEEIAARLRDRGLRVWLDKDQLRPGLPWQEGLEEGVRTSRSVAVFVGKDGMGAWQQPEMRAFLARARREAIPVIPVLLPDCPESPQLSLFLEAMTWVDLRDGLTDEGLARLVWGITGTKGENADRGPSKRPGRFNFPRTPRPWWSWGIALALLGVVVAVVAWRLARSPEPPPPPLRPQMYTVRARVLDPKGQPVAGSTIRSSTGDAPQSTQDSGWQIDIPEAKVPAGGQITLWAEHPHLGGNRRELRLGEDSNVQVEIRLKEPESWIRGLVVDESGRGLANVPVSTQEGTPGDAITDPKGRFAVKLSVPPETRVRVRAERKGLAPKETFCITGHDTCPLVLEDS